MISAVIRVTCSRVGVAALHNLIIQDASVLDDSHKQRLVRGSPTPVSSRPLCKDDEFLATINNEAKVRLATKSQIIGTARVMSYEDLD